MTPTEFKNELAKSERLSEQFDRDFAAAEIAAENCLLDMEEATRRALDLSDELDMESDWAVREEGFARLAQLEIAVQQADERCREAFRRMDAIVVAERKELKRLRAIDPMRLSIDRNFELN